MGSGSTRMTRPPETIVYEPYRSCSPGRMGLQRRMLTRDVFEVANILLQIRLRFFFCFTKTVNADTFVPAYSA